MKVCHICSNLDSFYVDFMKEQKLKKIDFKVFCFRAKNRHFTKIDVPNLDLRFDFNNWQRYVFFLKETLVLRDFINLYNHDEFDLYHAHTLFTNGYLAYKMNKKKNIPYIVAVRDTDLNVFFKKRMFLRPVGIRILKSASKIVFISKTYLEELLEKYVPEKYHEEFREKAVIIPNGINNFYHENSLLQDKSLSLNVPLSIITVGFISKRKNQLSVAKAIKKLNNDGYQIKYEVVGKTLNNKIENKLQTYSFVERTKFLSKEELIQKYRKAHIFVMPSITETFGLTYVEAMTQGLPIIYSRGQGIDGYFENGTVGCSVNSSSIEEIASCIVKVIKNYDYLARNAFSKSSFFKWEDIIDEYINTYKSILT